MIVNRIIYTLIFLYLVVMVTGKILLAALVSIGLVHLANYHDVNVWFASLLSVPINLFILSIDIVRPSNDS